PVTEVLTLAHFISRCAPTLEGGGCIVDQPFEPRIADGMVRCYFVGDAVTGFSRQYADPAAGGGALGIPSAKTMLRPNEPQFARLRDALENDWVPAMQKLATVDAKSLPVLWDADLLFGPRDADGK